MATTWEEIVAEGPNDKVLSRESRCLEEGQRLKRDESLSTYFIYDYALYLSYILYKDKLVVLVSLRSRVLNKLHSAHQGATAMNNHAQQIVFGLVLHKI